MEKRETRYRVQWYYRLFEETQRGLQTGTSEAVVHGSLLAMGEMLRHTGEFMLARYREVVSTGGCSTLGSIQALRPLEGRGPPLRASVKPDRRLGTAVEPSCARLVLSECLVLS